MEEKKNKTYAGQVADIARKDVHLSFTDRLSRMTEEEGDPFLNIFSAKSIYLARISHFDQGDNNKPAGLKQSLVANIPLKDLLMIKKRTDCAEDLMFRASFEKVEMPKQAQSQSAGQSVSPAFTPLRMGGEHLKGKAPGDILLSAQNLGQAIGMLQKQLQWLKSHLGQYPQNQSDVDAIEDALNCQSMGVLASMKPDADAVPEMDSVPAGQYIIYKTPVKHQKSVDKRTGKNNCYSIEISCLPDKDQPYRVQIMNCLAPLKQMANGLKPIDMKNAEDIKKEYVDLTEAEWLYVLDRLDENMRMTRAMWYPTLRKLDEANRWSPNNGNQNGNQAGNMPGQAYGNGYRGPQSGVMPPYGR